MWYLKLLQLRIRYQACPKCGVQAIGILGQLQIQPNTIADNKNISQCQKLDTAALQKGQKDSSGFCCAREPFIEKALEVQLDILNNGLV